jgi:hypothetical protein
MGEDRSLDIKRVASAIDSTRLSMQDTLEELKGRVQESTDWRRQVSRRPVTSLWVAIAVGLVLARIVVPSARSVRGLLGTSAKSRSGGLRALSSVSGAVALLTQLAALPPLVTQVRRFVGRLGSQLSSQHSSRNGN